MVSNFVDIYLGDIELEKKTLEFVMYIVLLRKQWCVRVCGIVLRILIYTLFLEIRP